MLGFHSRYGTDGSKADENGAQMLSIKLLKKTVLHVL
jgi:hypothetical protein